MTGDESSAEDPGASSGGDEPPTLVEGRATIDDVDGFLTRLGEIGDGHGATVQAFDPGLLTGPDHLRLARDRADRSIDRGENVARDRAVEILLYAAGRRQIEDALELGVDAGEGPVVVLVDGGDEAAAAAAIEQLLDPGPVAYGDPDRLQAYFGVGRAEREATDASLADLVHERVALLDVEK